jgi:3-hydroxybutyryl-CoA dehydratase
MAQYQVREQFTVGETAQVRKTVTEADVKALAEVTGDYNPLHTDDDFAARTRFQGRIVHGVLAAGLISAALGMKLPGPGAIYLSQTLNFVHPVRVGDTLTAEVEVTRWRPEKRIVNLKTRCFNQEGRDVLEGEAVLLMETLAEPA